MGHKVGSLVRAAVGCGALFAACQVVTSGDERDSQRASAQIQSELDAAALSNPSTFNSVRPLRPLLTCIASAGAGELVAHFGYENTGSAPIAIPVSFFNRFWRAPADRGQPTTFDPGSHPDVVTVTFGNSGTLVWVLGAHFAIANRFSRPCPVFGTGGRIGGIGGAGGLGGIGTGGLGGAGGMGGVGGTFLPCSDPAACDDHNPCTTDVPIQFVTGFGCVCDHPWLANGTSCTDACNQVGACQGSKCIAGPNTTCPPPDQCHIAGSCSDPATVCTPPQVGFGWPCDAGGGPNSGACNSFGACLPAGTPFACGNQACTPGSSYCRELRGIAGHGGTVPDTFSCSSFLAGCTAADCSCTIPGAPTGYFCVDCRGSAATGILQGCYAQ